MSDPHYVYISPPFPGGGEVGHMIDSCGHFLMNRCLSLRYHPVGPVIVDRVQCACVVGRDRRKRSMQISLGKSGEFTERGVVGRSCQCVVSYERAPCHRTARCATTSSGGTSDEDADNGMGTLRRVRTTVDPERRQRPGRPDQPLCHRRFPVPPTTAGLQSPG